MATSMLELGVGTGKWDAGLKKAKQSLDNFIQANGGLQQALEKESQKMQKFVSMMGQMDSTAKTAKGQMNDYKATIEQLTMQYNRMSEAQKKTIGQDYLNSIEQIKEKFRQAKAEVEGINKSLGDMKMPDMKGGGFLSGLGDKMSGALQVFAGNLMTKGTGMLAGLASEMGDMVKQGVELAKQGEGIRIAFERLGRGDILDGLREATHGTVTDIELMKAAVKFNDFKLPLDELGTMLAFAQQKAKDTGQSVDYMVDSIVTGLGRKSLMILDNLGLSATEVKDKMKDTGDMTKAVGAIIREQMAKAGDYVETAADRAAQANVSLQNKMEELGRKFAPLEEASNNFWTSMKIGILDVIGGPLTNLLNKLTQAGRMANAYGLMGGNAKVGRMTANLAGASEQNRQSIYQQQQQEIWRYINRRENALKERDRWFKDMGNKELGEHLSKEYQAFGTADRGEIQAQIDAAKKMLSEYQQSAKQILTPVKANIDTKGAEQNVESLKAKLIELEAQRKKAIAAGDTDLSKNLAKQISQVKSDIKGLRGSTTNKTTTKTPKTEEQQNAARIDKLIKQYQDLATAAKTADDAQKAGLTERMTKIQGEITTLQDRNAELKKFADEARQVQYPVGSLPQLNEQLKTLQTEQEKALDAKQWKDYQRQIEQTQYQIDALKGKWQDGLQATFKLNIEQQGSTDINTAKPEDITVTFKADDADVLSKVRDIEGIAIDPKTLTVTAETQEAIAALQRVEGLALQPKTAEVTFRADDADVLEKLRDIDGITIDPKTLSVTAETQEAITDLQRIDGLTLQPKTAEVTFRADDADVLEKLRDIDGITIDPKTLSVTANTAEAYNKVQELLKSVDGKTVTFTVQPAMEVGTSIQNDAGMSAYIASLKQQLETADYGTSLYNGLSAQLADMTTLQNLVGESLKAGLGTAMFDAADETGKDFWTRAMEGGVDNIDWQTIADKINEARKAAGLDTIVINFKTGGLKEAGKDANTATKDFQKAASAIGSVGSALSSIEDPSAKVAGIVAQAIATVASAFAGALGTDQTTKSNIWAFIAAAAASTATMISTIASIHSATGYAQGGQIKGNSYSGDNILGMVDGGTGGFVGLNAGEIVLNQAQTANVANALEGSGMRGIELSASVSGEQILLVANRTTRRQGRGELVTFKNQ